MYILFKTFFKNNYITIRKIKRFDIFFHYSHDINNKLKVTNKIYSIIKYFIVKKSNFMVNYDVSLKKKRKINKKKIHSYLGQYLLNIYHLNSQNSSFWILLSMIKFLVVKKHKLLNIKKILFTIKYYRNFFLKYRIYFLLISLKIIKFMS
jgi:hypothetical protein